MFNGNILAFQAKVEGSNPFIRFCGYSSAEEYFFAKEKVIGSNPISRSLDDSAIY